MNKVYFLKDFGKLREASQKLLKGFYSDHDTEVAVKIHFGEPGNKFAFTPKDVKPIIEAMKSLELKPFFIDTTVAYNSPRNSVEGYGKVVRDKGYDKLAPFIISDSGLKVKAKDLMVEVCQELVKAKNVLVISHLKGHGCSGFGGAIKNLGMGGVTKETKKLEHALSKPRLVGKCRGCGQCVELCPAKAIKMVNGQAEINLSVCWGCSICEISCPNKCLAPKATFDDLLAQGAAAVINNLPPQTFYINFLKNIAKDCDCNKNPGGLISKDIGILFSDNPVAIDKASIDLINEANGQDVFKIHNHKDPLLQLKFASQYTSREQAYQLVAMD